MGGEHLPPGVWRTEAAAAIAAAAAAAAAFRNDDGGRPQDGGWELFLLPLRERRGRTERRAKLRSPKGGGKEKARSLDRALEAACLAVTASQTDPQSEAEERGGGDGRGREGSKQA